VNFDTHTASLVSEYLIEYLLECRTQPNKNRIRHLILLSWEIKRAFIGLVSIMTSSMGVRT